MPYLYIALSTGVGSLLTSDIEPPDLKRLLHSDDWMVFISAVVDTTFVDIYVDTKNIPTCRYNIQHIDKKTMENKMLIIMWEAAMSYATTFK